MNIKEITAAFKAERRGISFAFFGRTDGNIGGFPVSD